MLLKILAWSLLLNLVASGKGSFTFNGFQRANLSLDGSASVFPNGLLMLTSLSKHLKGHAFFPVPLRFKKTLAGKVESFSTTFVFALVPEYPNMGGSGFTFALCPTTNFSGAFANQFFGLFNMKTDGKSSNHILAVEFDTAQNPDLKDINDNHVGIDINNLTSIESHTAGYVSDDHNLEFKNLTLISGEPIQAWIENDGIKMQLNVTLAPLNMSKPDLPLLSSTVNLSSVILDSMYVGFSSATSIIISYHYILGWSFKMNGKAPALNLSSLPSLPPRTMSAGKKKQIHLTLWLPLAVSTVILISFAAVMLHTKRKNKFAELLEDWELDFGPQRFLYKELFQATKGFKDKHLLGVGGFGKVYRGVLHNPKTEVAVKRVNHESREVREFITEMASISQLRHRNLVQLLGYCRHRGELLLVYDYMPNGSLDKFLFEQPKSMLNWSQRFRIIKGVASGLLYLHEDCEKVIIHRDIKASNVLLDSEFNGRLGDFGLAKLYDHGTDPKTTHVVGTMGYIAPELSRTSKATTRSDVFAFGAFVLEVACGRRPIEPSEQAEEKILVDWVFKNWQRGAILETSDPRLECDYVVEEMELVLKLGLLCSHPMPAARPSMRQVTQFLEGDVPLPELLHIDPIAVSLVSIQNEESGNYNIMLYPSLVTVESVQSIGE